MAGVQRDEWRHSTQARRPPLCAPSQVGLNLELTPRRCAFVSPHPCRLSNQVVGHTIVSLGQLFDEHGSGAHPDTKPVAAATLLGKAYSVDVL